jgi:RimJ/RimL family protein N-acetyltransferase
MADKNDAYLTHKGLVGKNIYLRAATSQDIANTYHWHLQSDPAMLSCRPQPFQNAAEAAEGYKKHVGSISRQTFMIVRKDDNTPVGRIVYFDLNPLNRSVEFGLIIDPDERKNGYAFEATRLLVGYLFNTRDLNKVYGQTSSLNKATAALLEKAGFKRDAVLRHHYFYDGELHDGYVYSILRFEYER